MAEDVLDGWDLGSFEHGGRSYPTYRRGSGPGVIIVHEIPGITPAVTRFANDVVDAGFTVVMPSLLGTPGRAMSNGYAMGSMLKLCVSKEFTSLGLRRTSPVADWLRALARSLHGELGGPGVGAIGMCFSGGFALAMMVDAPVIAPVLSQPSLPLAFLGRKRAGDIGLSDADLAAVKQKTAAGCDVLGLRFSDDALVGTRFETLRRELGDHFIAIELPSSSKRDHSVVTEQRDEPTVEKVLRFFHDRLVEVTAS